jgi:hypothetical protein
MKRIGIVAALSVMSIAPALISAQSNTSYTGGTDYQAFCASCHGADGKGDGVIAATLKRRPTDLTQLAAKNAGVFPADKVFKTIDSGVSPHGGSPDMPEWASVFAKSRESEGPEQVKARIVALVKYLETIQAKH